MPDCSFPFKESDGDHGYQVFWAKQSQIFLNETQKKKKSHFSGSQIHTGIQTGEPQKHTQNVREQAEASSLQDVVSSTPHNKSQSYNQTKWGSKHNLYMCWQIPGTHIVLFLQLSALCLSFVSSSFPNLAPNVPFDLLKCLSLLRSCPFSFIYSVSPSPVLSFCASATKKPLIQTLQREAWGDSVGKALGRDTGDWQLPDCEELISFLSLTGSIMIRCGKQSVLRVSAHQPIILLIFFRKGLEEVTAITGGFKCV